MMISDLIQLLEEAKDEHGDWFMDIELPGDPRGVGGLTSETCDCCDTPVIRLHPCTDEDYEA